MYQRASTNVQAARRGLRSRGSSTLQHKAAVGRLLQMLPSCWHPVSVQMRQPRNLSACQHRGHANSNTDACDVSVCLLCSYSLTRDQFIHAMQEEMSERGVTVDAVTLGALFSIFDRDG